MGANLTEPKQIKFRVSEAEYERLKNMATDLGLSMAMFAKRKTMGVKTRQPKIAKAEALGIASELRRIGTNVNQIAKRVNTGGGVADGELDSILKGLRLIWRSLN